MTEADSAQCASGFGEVGLPDGVQNKEDCAGSAAAISEADGERCGTGLHEASCSQRESDKERSATGFGDDGVERR